MRTFLKWFMIASASLLITGFAAFIILINYLFAGGCDEGPYNDSRIANTRGDVVMEYSKACTGIGTVVDDSVVLKLAGADKYITLLEHESHPFPTFHWIDDDTLRIDLGKVTWTGLKLDRFGRIKIIYTHGLTE